MTGVPVHPHHPCMDALDLLRQMHDTEVTL